MEKKRPGAETVLLTAAALMLLTMCGVPSRLSIFDRFRKTPDGVITDIATGLQWKPGPDRDFDWHGAGRWIAGLDGDWRIPTFDELEELRRAGITTETWGPFDNTGWLVWCVRYTSRNMAFRYCFIPNDVFLGVYPCAPAGQRVFAVLSPRGYGTVAFNSSVWSPTNMPQLDPI